MHFRISLHTHTCEHLPFLGFLRDFRPSKDMHAYQRRGAISKQRKERPEREILFYFLFVFGSYHQKACILLKPSGGAFYDFEYLHLFGGRKIDNRVEASGASNSRRRKIVKGSL